MTNRNQLTSLHPPDMQAAMPQHQLNLSLQAPDQSVAEPYLSTVALPQIEFCQRLPVPK